MKRNDGKAKIIVILLLLIIIIAVIAFVYVKFFLNKDEEPTEEKPKISKVEEPEKLEILNNGGNYVKYGDYLYYWKLNDSSREHAALFANYQDSENVKNELIKRSEDGDEEVLLKDYGSGSIFILNDRIYLSYQEKEWSDRVIYSVDLDGKDKTEHGKGLIKFTAEDDLICQTTDKDIFKIDTKTGKTETIKEKSGALGYVDGKIFYSNFDNIYSFNLYTLYADDLEIGYIEDGKDSGIVATFKRTEFMGIDEAPIEIMDFWEEKGLIKMYVGYTGGTAHIVQQEFELTMDLDGSNLKSKQVNISEGGFTDETHTKEGVITSKSENNDVYYYYNGTEKLFSQSDIKKEFDLTTDNMEMINIPSSDKIEDELYILLDYNKYSPENSVGWRDGYTREKTIVFIYDTKNEEITKLYEF